MDYKFKDCSFPAEFSKIIDNSTDFVLKPEHIFMIVESFFHGTSKCLANMKNTKKAKAIVFRNIGGEFLIAAKVEYMPNENDPDNPASGSFMYTWTFYEEDVKDADCVDATSNLMVGNAFSTSARKLHNIGFDSATSNGTIFAIMFFEYLRVWLTSNATEKDQLTLTLDGSFKATAELDSDGKVVMGLVPADSMKLIIKDDSSIQEN